MTPDSFDRMLRDYAVRYVATIKWRTGLRENETQLEYSSLYDFSSVASFGSIEVLEVLPKRTGPAEFRTITSDADSVILFRTAIRILQRPGDWDDRLVDSALAADVGITIDGAPKHARP